MTAPMTREELLASIETVVRLAIGDGEYIGRHARDMTPQAVIDLQAGTTAERLKAVRALLGVAQQPWQPIETAPKDGNLLIDYGGHVIIGGFDRHRQEWTDGDNYIPVKEIRGWQLIPPPSNQGASK
jgi:hypothetical protein